MKKSEAIAWALETLDFPVLSSKEELKARYYVLAKTVHPDCGGDEASMARVNEAYQILKEYMDNFKFTFSDEEIAKQFPEELYVNRFRF